MSREKEKRGAPCELVDLSEAVEAKSFLNDPLIGEEKRS